MDSCSILSVVRDYCWNVHDSLLLETRETATSSGECLITNINN